MGGVYGGGGGGGGVWGCHTKPKQALVKQKNLTTKYRNKTRMVGGQQTKTNKRNKYRPHPPTRPNK